MVVCINIHNHDSMSSADRIEQLQALARFPSRAEANELAVEVAAEHDLSPAALVDLMLAVQGDTRRATSLAARLALGEVRITPPPRRGCGRGPFKALLGDHTASSATPAFAVVAVTLKALAERR
jgi:hypothetical protein